MRLFFICFPLFLSAWWSIIFTECDEKEDKTTYKKNKELYISDITSSVGFIKTLLEKYKDTVAKLLNGFKDDSFKTEIEVEIKKLNSIFNSVTFNIDFDFIEPLCETDNKKFTHIPICCPTNLYRDISTSATQEQLLVTNKIIIYTWVLSYILQLKNNMLSYIINEEEKNVFNKNFYNKVLKPLLEEIEPIIANIYEEGKKGDKKDSGEEKSFFDLPPVTFNFIDKNEFVIKFYNEHFKKININNKKIIDTKINDENSNIDNGKINNNNEEIKGLLWRIGNNEKIINR